MEKLGEISGIMKVFKKFDRNGDGQVSHIFFIAL